MRSTPAASCRKLVGFLRGPDSILVALVALVVGGLLGPSSLLAMGIIDIWLSEPDGYTLSQLIALIVTTVFVAMGCAWLFANTTNDGDMKSPTSAYLSAVWLIACVAILTYAIIGLVIGGTVANGTVTAGAWMALVGWVSLDAVIIDTMDDQSTT